MERKIEIPTMSNEEIARWYKTIKPIVQHDGQAVYLRELTSNELTYFAYTGLNKADDYADYVDFSRLSTLTDVKMLHGYGYYGFFKPSVGEVIRQIPLDMLDKVVAFEMLYSPDTAEDFNLFNKEFHAGFHVSVVRLYQAKNNMNEEAEQVEKYPTKESVLPIGMSEEKFKKLKAMFGEED